jgi:hypothetical protein
MNRILSAVCLLVVLAILAAFASGCRTAGPQIALNDCRDCRVDLRGNLDAAQGKTVSGEVSPAVSAGVTAQANGNAVSQSGAATASPSGTYDASADAQATPPDPAESQPPADTDDAPGEPEESD